MMPQESVGAKPMEQHWLTVRWERVLRETPNSSLKRSLAVVTYGKMNPKLVSR